jgi:dimethylaniline monooxygenase (N-oxide forming)
MYECIIVGAGPGGIVCAKELIENGIDNIICVEKSSSLGGVFRHSYDHLVLTSSAVMSMYSDFWIGDENTCTNWSKHQAVDYWERYARHFQVSDRIRFGTEVSSAELSENGEWIVSTSQGEQLKSTRLVVATGNNSIPAFPAWKDQCGSKELTILHSHMYRNSDALRDKRVLVVGGGESGTDIAWDVSKVASRCWVSLRESTGWVTPRRRGAMPADIATHRALWGLPRSYGPSLTRSLIRLEKGRDDPVSDASVTLNEKVASPLGAFGTYGTKSFALPRAMVDHGCRLVGEIQSVSGQDAITVDGQSIEALDAIIFCTGYKNRVEFLDDDLQSVEPRNLFRHLLHPDYGERLAWIGWAMQQEIESNKSRFLQQFGSNAQRIASLVDYRLFMDDLAKDLGCAPPYWRYFLFHHAIWRKIMFGALQGTQFRLRGVDGKPEIARDILSRCPRLPFSNKLLKLGLIGRVKTLFLRSGGDGGLG